MFFKACYSNLTSIAHLLIQENANLDIQNSYGDTALYFGILFYIKFFKKLHVS